MLENMTLSLIKRTFLVQYNVFKRKHNLHIQSKERGKYANMSAYKITSYMYQGLISRALFAGTTTWNIIWTLPIKPNQYEIHMILHYLAGRKIQYLGALGDVWSLATHSRRKVFLVKNSRNFVLICYSAQIPDIKWGGTNGACIMCVGENTKQPFLCQKSLLWSVSNLWSIGLCSNSQEISCRESQF